EGDGALVDITAVAPARAGRHGHHLRRLGAEHTARGVDALHAEVIDGSAPETALQARALGILDPHRVVGADRFGNADVAGADEGERAHHGRAHVQSVRDHELDAIGLTRANHAPALVRRDRHGWLAQDVHTGAGGFDGVVTVQRVWQRYVDGVHIVALQTLAELVVMVRGGLELPSDELGLGAIAGNDSHEPRIGADRCEGREHGGPRDHPEAHDCESELLCHFDEYFLFVLSNWGASARPLVDRATSITRDAS